MTQKRLSVESGVDAISISRYERAKRNPLVKTLQKLARALKVSVEELLDT
jgi:transcriptional regulator with XRE-family HTH domain